MTTTFISPPKISTSTHSLSSLVYCATMAILEHHIHSTMFKVTNWYLHWSTALNPVQTLQLFVVYWKVYNWSLSEKCQPLGSLLVIRLSTLHRRSSKHHDQVCEQICQMIYILPQRSLPLTSCLPSHLISYQVPLSLCSFCPHGHLIDLLPQVIPDKMIQLVKSKLVIPQNTHSQICISDNFPRISRTIHPLSVE